MSETTVDRVLDAAQEMIQTRGYNGFSFRDIAATVGIKSASVHYHFPCKADLGVALVDRYRVSFGAELKAIEAQQAGAAKRLKGFTTLFRRTLDANRLCLCGMLAAEQDSLPEAVNAQVRRFFERCEAWLADVLKQGRAEGSIQFRGTPAAQAAQLLALLQGAMITARSLSDPARFERIAGCYLRGLKQAA